MSVSPDQIHALCDAWCAASQPEKPGGINFNPAVTDQYRLRNNGVFYPHLSFDALCAALSGTSKVLLHKGLNSIRDLDHDLLWLWCAELLLNHHPQRKIFPNERWEVEALFKSVVHGICVGPELRRIDKRALPRNSRLFLERASGSAAYLSFPTLEATLRLVCKEYVSYDGIVQKDFAITLGGAEEKYSVGKVVNKLHHLILLFMQAICKSEAIKKNMLIFANHIKSLDQKYIHPWKVIFQWRNGHLHGGPDYMAIGGSILNLTFLIALSQITDDYDSRCREALAGAEWAGKHSPGADYFFFNAS